MDGDDTINAAERVPSELWYRIASYVDADRDVLALARASRVARDGALLELQKRVSANLISIRDLEKLLECEANTVYYTIDCISGYKRFKITDPGVPRVLRRAVGYGGCHALDAIERIPNLQRLNTEFTTEIGARLVSVATLRVLEIVGWDFALPLPPNLRELRVAWVAGRPPGVTNLEHGVVLPATLRRLAFSGPARLRLRAPLPALEAVTADPGIDVSEPIPTLRTLGSASISHRSTHIGSSAGYATSFTRHLHYYYLPTVSDLGMFPALDTLALIYEPFASATAASWPATLTYLEVTKMPAGAMAALARCTALRDLVLEQSDIVDLTPLADAARPIENLRLQNCNRLESFKGIGNFASLIFLHVSFEQPWTDPNYNDETGREPKIIATDSILECQTLKKIEFILFVFKNWNYISQLKNIEEIRVVHMGISDTEYNFRWPGRQPFVDDGIGALAALPTLRLLYACATLINEAKVRTFPDHIKYEFYDR